MPNQNRRNVLKALAAAGATAAVPFGLQAGSTSLQQTDKHLAVYIDAKHGQTRGSATSEIVNHADRPLVLNGYQPVTYRNEKGHYITLHLNTPNEIYRLQPGERLPIYAKAVMTNSPKNLTIQNKWIKNSISIV